MVIDTGVRDQWVELWKLETNGHNQGTVYYVYGALLISGVFRP